MKQLKKKTNGDTEQRILDAAHAVFVRRGTAGARMQEIAAEAGVNQALLHSTSAIRRSRAGGAERAWDSCRPSQGSRRTAKFEKVRRVIDLG
jgi:hypothetical protein